MTAEWNQVLEQVRVWLDRDKFRTTLLAELAREYRETPAIWNDIASADASATMPHQKTSSGIDFYR